MPLIPGNLFSKAPATIIYISIPSPVITNRILSFIFIALFCISKQTRRLFVYFLVLTKIYIYIFFLQKAVANSFIGKLYTSLRKKLSWHSAASAFQCHMDPAKFRDPEGKIYFSNKNVWNIEFSFLKI